MSFYFNGNTPKKILYNGLNVAKLVYNGVVVWMSKVLATISGILPLTLTDCTGDDLVDYKIYGKSEHEELPDEYQQIEYIESTGTQYIDTGIKTNTTTSRYETKINPSSVSGTMCIFGTRNNTTADQRAMNVFIIDGTFRLDWLSGNGSYTVRNISSNTEYAISITRGLATINNVNHTSRNTTSIDGSYTFYVGSLNNAGSVYPKGFSGKIYYSKLYNNNILVFDGVPCYRKSDNEIGMYDLVSNTFFTNAGTGKFNVGSVVSKKSVGDLVTDTSDVNYGKYKIPVLTNSTATNIYLNKPLRRASKFIAGAEVETVYYTDYLDYGNQKVVRNVDDNDEGLDTPVEESIVLPAVATDEGTVTVNVDTEIAPSNAEIKYYKNGS